MKLDEGDGVGLGTFFLKIQNLTLWQRPPRETVNLASRSRKKTKTHTKRGRDARIAW